MANISRFFWSLPARLWRLVTTPYRPAAACDSFMDRAQTQEQPRAAVTVAVLTGREAKTLFGVDVARRGIQPVFLRIVNRSAESLRLQMVSIDPNYFTPLEAAGVNHFSIFRRLSAFGAMGWVFLPLLGLVPLKLVTAWLNNARMDDFFRGHGFRLGPIAPGETAEGFVFTTLDLGTKAVHVRLTTLGNIRNTIAAATGPAIAETPGGPAATDFFFTVPVPGIAADYLDRDFASIRPAASVEPCTIDTLVSRLEALPSATMNAAQSRRGDPVNLVLIGEFETLLSGFAARWDESETITLATCWKTVRAFLWGSNYRYSPVSPLHLFGRDQDIALQRTRHSIMESHHAPDRSQRRRVAGLRDRRPDAHRAGGGGGLRGRRASLPSRRAPPQPHRRSLLHRRQAGRHPACTEADAARRPRLSLGRILAVATEQLPHPATDDRVWRLARRQICGGAPHLLFFNTLVV